MDRLKDPGAIEHRLLELAHTTDAKITAPALAFFAPCSLDDATRVLDDLTTHNRLSMEIEDDGTIVYQMLGRQKLDARAPQTGLVRARRRHPDARPLIAAVLGALVPGAGHAYAGRIGAAILWFLVVSVGYVLLLPGLVLHLFSIVSAAASTARLRGTASPQLLAPPPAGGHRTSA